MNLALLCIQKLNILLLLYFYSVFYSVFNNEKGVYRMTKNQNITQKSSHFKSSRVSKGEGLLGSDDGSEHPRSGRGWWNQTVGSAECVKGEEPNDCEALLEQDQSDDGCRQCQCQWFVAHRVCVQNRGWDAVLWMGGPIRRDSVIHWRRHLFQNYQYEQNGFVSEKKMIVIYKKKHPPLGERLFTPLHILRTFKLRKENADPSGRVVFECPLATVTLQPINYLLYIRVIANGDYRLYKSAIEMCKGVTQLCRTVSNSPCL